jgi:CHASE3 domain sensor protein
MPIKRPFLLYLRSRLNYVLSITGASLVVLSLVFLRPYALVPIIVILLAYSALTGALFFSRRGAREVVAESEEDRLKKIRQKIDASAGIRERISVLRIGDERMARAIEYFLQESGSYLEKCQEISSYSPLANERIERVMEICQVFLGELDETATARRYDVRVVPAEPGIRATDIGERFARDIMECARVIKERTTEDLLGLSGEARLAIMNELEENK